MYKILLSEVNTNFSDIKYGWQLIEETEIGPMLLSRGYSPTLDEAYKEAKKEYRKCKR
jgi:hypothetical protein